jgi:hypothetical protein
MSNNGPKSLSDLIAAGESSLGKLAGEARRRADLGEHLRSGLGAGLGAGITHCNIDSANAVTVLAASPEWAARLRYEAGKILELVREKEPGVERVRVRVAAA